MQHSICYASCFGFLFAPSEDQSGLNISLKPVKVTMNCKHVFLCFSLWVGWLWTRWPCDSFLDEQSSAVIKIIQALFVGGCFIISLTLNSPLFCSTVCKPRSPRSADPPPAFSSSSLLGGGLNELDHLLQELNATQFNITGLWMHSQRFIQQFLLLQSIDFCYFICRWDPGPVSFFSERWKGQDQG